MKPITPATIKKLKVNPRRTPITIQNLATTGLHCYVTLPKPETEPTTTTPTFLPQ